MLKSIRLKNFKLHEDTSIEAAPITIFIGPNNSGKSSIFQALLAVRKAAAAPTHLFLAPVQRLVTSPEQPFLFEALNLIDLGDFKDALRHGQNEVWMSLGGAPPPSRHLGYVDASLELGIDDNALGRHEGRLQSPLGELKWRHSRSAQPGTFPQPQLRTPDGTIVFRTANHFKLIELQSTTLLPASPSPDAANRLHEIGQEVAAVPSALLASLRPVFPLRGFEEWGCPLPRQTTENLDRLVLPDRAVAIASVLGANIKLRKQVSARLQQLLGIGIDVEVFERTRVKVFATSDFPDGGETLLVNEGTGANQLPFILVPIALAASGDTILLSEPEAHLHPKGQCELTRMLLAIAKKENIQFFIETHSEHVLHTILNAIARGEWARDEVALQYFQNKNGVADVSRREINQFGQVDGGLPDFFEQSLAELTEYLKALGKT